MTLKELCECKLKEKNLDSKEYLDRLKLEIEEITAVNEDEYFLELYKNNKKFALNENNLLVPYLLGIVEDFDIGSPPEYFMGEFPDIDIDIIDEVRDYLKKEWLPEKFGRDYVCSIATYGSLNIKQALLDMTAVHGVPKDEIQEITKKIQDKDEDNKPLGWDAIVANNAELQAYCQKYPEIADAARLAIGRNKSIGVHAGGIIISSMPLTDLVPLQTTKDETIVSAWGEGQRSQDLQPVGLVKFDLLSIHLKKAAYACELIRQRYGIEKICALPGQASWSDLSYLNDPKSLEAANKGDFVGVFQFDGSDGIRSLAKKGGVSSFDDIFAYTSLYRPPCLKVLPGQKHSMADRYCMRNRGIEKYEIHPVLEPILGSTKGVMFLQESVMKVLHVVGGIPLKDCEALRKAISKKKEEKFRAYKVRFLEEGAKKLGSLESAEQLWAEIEAFAGYGFNKSHAVGYSYLSMMELYLKTHFPLEFFCSLLTCEQDLAKIKEYRRDAAKHGISIKGIDINHSKVDFAIQDNQIYFGFAKLKDIGVDVAEKIVSGQPYSSVEDFLHKNGTNLTLFRALTCLGVFEHWGDKDKLFKYFEYYRGIDKKIKGIEKRIETKKAIFEEKLKELINDKLPGISLEDFTKLEWTDLFIDDFVEVPRKVKNKIKIDRIPKVIIIHNLLNKASGEISKNLKAKKDLEIASLEPFNFEGEIQDKTAQKLLSLPLEETEKEFYGFIWNHPLDCSPDALGMTATKLVESEAVAGPVEVLLSHWEKKLSKNGKTTFYKVYAEDANGEDIVITMWEDDFKKWENTLESGNLLRMRLKPPMGKFPGFTFESPSRQEKWKNKNKPLSEDCRIVKLNRG